MKPIKVVRRFYTQKPVGNPKVLKPDNSAVVEGRALYRSMVKVPTEFDRIFKDGGNNRKIGNRVSKGPWAGMPIFTLTLEERYTCPTYCEHWRDCYGNNMHRSTRWTEGKNLKTQINRELVQLQMKYPGGFVLRLHVLGDFYNAGYVRFWESRLTAFPAIRVWGYTRWDKTSAQGRAIQKINDAFPDRWSVRFSNQKGEMTTVTTPDTTLRGRTPEGIVCPAQTEQDVCCGSCALCWSTKDPIIFITH